MGMMFRVLLAMLLCASAQAQTKFITVASTTSTEQSGLFKHLLPAFEKKAGFQVRVSLNLAEEDRAVEVLLSQERFAELGLRPGEDVYVKPKEVKVFQGEQLGDYVI